MMDRFKRLTRWTRWGLHARELNEARVKDLAIPVLQITFEGAKRIVVFLLELDVAVL